MPPTMVSAARPRDAQYVRSACTACSKSPKSELGVTHGNGLLQPRTQRRSNKSFSPPFHSFERRPSRMRGKWRGV